RSRPRASWPSVSRPSLASSPACVPPLPAATSASPSRRKPEAFPSRLRSHDMSCSDTTRVVNTVRSQAAVDQVLNRNRVDQVLSLLGVELARLPALECALDNGEACSLRELQSALEEVPVATPLSAIDVLDAGRQVLEVQAAEANLDPQILAPLV